VVLTFKTGFDTLVVRSFNSFAILDGGHMVLNTKDGRMVVLRSLLFGSMLAGALMLGACGSSEQTAASDDEGFEDTTMAEQPQEQAAQEQPKQEEAKDESSDQQALTSFIGAAPKKEAQEVKQPEPQPVQVEPAPPINQPNPLDDLRTENTGLKQQIVKLEQDNRSLNARISDAEAKYMAEKDRADKAEEAAKVAAQSAAISARGAEVTMAPAPTGDAMAAYEDALKTFQGKSYDDTISKLQAMVDGGVPDDLADNCQYWLGEANFGKKNYEEAIKHFEQVLQFKKSEKMADAHYMIAQSYDRLGNKAKAKEEYETVVKDFPTSRLVAKAKDRWARL
jgi:TolA-binding protein